MGAVGTTISSKFTVTDNQRRIENAIRDDANENVYWLDKDGNTIIKAVGDGDSVEYEDDAEFNHKVEQAVWDGQEIHTTHNHPESTIFSPEDIDSLVDLENKSLSAVLPKGSEFSAFRLIREQPITDNTIIWNPEKNDFDKAKNWTSKYEPKMLQVDYYNAYADVYDGKLGNTWDKADSDLKYGKITKEEHRKIVEPLRNKLNTTMIKWLDKNAKDYGFRFVKEK